jgi:hypothetical protein
LPYSEKVHLRNCAIWFLIITVISVLISVFSYGKFDFIEYGKPNEYALGFIIEYFLVFLIYILPISIFRFCIRKKPVYTWIAAWLIAILYTALCSAVEVLVYDLLFELEMEPVGRFHGFFIPFLLHGGQYTPKPETVDVQPVSDQHELPDDEQKEPSEYELQMRQEYKRYRQLRDERQKIPVNDIRQWHDEGKMTDEQYNKIMSAYNAMGLEMDEIRKRVKLMNQSNTFHTEKDESSPKKKERNFSRKLPIVIAWCSSILLVICVPVIVWLYQQNATLAYDYDVLLKANENITKQRDQYVKISKNLQEDYDLLDEKYNDLSWDHLELRLSLNKLNISKKNTLNIGDSQQDVIDACGSPDRMVEQYTQWGSEDGWKWFYGTSYIIFDKYDDTVEAWYIGDTPLPVE